MNTPSHAILNLGLLAKPQQSHFNLLIVFGAILPDIPIFVFYLVAKYIQRLPERQIWSTAYYQPFWQNIVHLFHSIPLALIGLAIARYYGWKPLEIVFLSMVLHSLGDLPVHSDDAHRHFLPFSDYRFIERSLVLVATVYAFGMVHSYIGKALLIAVNLIYWLSYLYFSVF